MHWFPMAAAAVGGDPLDLHVERFDQLVADLVDIERWKNGEKERDRQHRKFVERLERVT